MRNRVALFVILIFCFLADIHGDEFHSIDGLYGERASGLAGAYSALSDDPSGAYYNPGGLIFAVANRVSLSASGYNKTSKSFENLLGFGQSYERKSSAYAPNLIGSLNVFGKFAVAFTVVNTRLEDFNQADQFYYPHFFSQLNQITSDYTNNATQFLIGPSLSYRLSNRLGFGVSLYYFNDRMRTRIDSRGVFTTDGFTTLTTNDARTTDGLEPVFGWQYIVSKTLSLGLSVRRKFLNSKHRRTSYISTPQYMDPYNYNVVTTQTGPPGTPATTTYSPLLASDYLIDESTGDIMSWFVPVESIPVSNKTGLNDSILVGKSLSTARIPEVPQLRMGFAYYPTPKFLLSFDFIYTDGYSVKKNLYMVDINNPIVYYNDDRYRQLELLSTRNFAIGMEYYLTESLVIRGGYFTNKSNTKPINRTLRAMVYLYQELQSLDTLSASTGGGGYLIYANPELSTPARNEKIDLEGISLAVGYETAKNSTSLTYVLQKENIFQTSGSRTGMPQLLQVGFAAPMKYRNQTILLSAGIKY
ncbi:MAG: hypothetical protein H7A23_09460 [Leptospiraceae bacterium]|nr:hypothetical protein [Leptospiraceae bacterium]MCP5494770.1 hypothetical protein [Leptospiraceae bacterium]